MPVALSNLLHVARDAMSVNAKALDVTGQNIANVNTAGYARRRVEIQARAATQDSYGGVTVGSITRAADQLTQRRLLDVRGQEQSARERGDALAPVEAALNDASGTGLAGGLTRLFDAFNALASKPTDTTVRAGVLSAAEGITQDFALVTESIDTARADLLAKAQGYTRQLNENARAIAELNGSIQSALSAGRDAADLLDRRDQLLGGLSELVDVQIATNPNGSLFVRAAGQALVEGSTSSTFSVDLDASGNLAFKTSVGGSPATAFNASTMGGKLGGIRQARDEDMTATRQRLDALAGDLAASVNALHEAGFGLDGQTGRKLFAFDPAIGVRSLAVDAGVAGRPERIAASANAATGGNDVARQLAGLDSSKTAAGGTKTLLDSYADLVGDLGLRRQKANGDADVKGALADQVEALQQSTTGVSLDEEMVELTRFQRAFEASSKLLKTFDELMQTLINSA
jgi:flagellar hook-associated protein 1 FlgK